MADRSNVSTKKLVKSKSGLRIVATNEIYKSPFELCEPPWTPDSESSHCTYCKTRFDFINRRHHCRRCGQIYCKTCCETKVNLPRMCFVDPVRVCGNCADVTKKENEFYEKHLKTLMNGATFQLSSSEMSNMEISSYYICRLSSDHRCIIFESAVSAIREPVELCQIRLVNIVKNLDDNQGASILELLYRNEQKEEKEIKLAAAPEPHRRQAMIWIAAMQKAMKMVYECREPRDNIP